MKVVMMLMFVAVLAALASAGVFMLRKGPPSEARRHDMARALALRVALSVALFLLILLSWHMGWIHPNGVALGR
jgi:hypothetical protein